MFAMADAEVASVNAGQGLDRRRPASARGLRAGVPIIHGDKSSESSALTLWQVADR
jgi:hypothetical protein